MKNLFFTLCLMALITSCGNTQQASEAATTDATTETPNEVPAAPAPVAATSVLNIGDIAPDFTLPGTDGESHTLTDFTAADGSPAKGYIVTFTCNTCPYAKKYEDRIIALHETTAPMGYPVVAIQPNDPEIKPDDGMDAMAARATEKSYGFAYLLDEGQAVYPTYGATRTPEFFLLDADRKLHFHGAMDDDVEGDNVQAKYVEAAIAAIEAGQQVDPQNVKAVGCTIKAR